MNIRNIFKREPIGATSLVISILAIISPMAWSSIDNALFYSEKFDIRCDELLASNAELDGETVVQEANCTIVNNSDSDVSLVGVKSAIFHDTRAYTNLLLPEELRVEVLPAFLRRGEFYKFRSLYYAPLGSDIILKGSESCIAPDSLPSDRLPITKIQVCENSKSTGKNPLEYFYEGVGWQLYTFNRLGLVIQIGNGRDIYYSPSYELRGVIKTKEEMARSFGFFGSKSQWSDPPRFWRDIIPMISFSLVFLMLYGMSFFAIRSLANKLKRVELKLVEELETTTPIAGRSQ